MARISGRRAALLLVALSAAGCARSHPEADSGTDGGLDGSRPDTGVDAERDAPDAHEDTGFDGPLTDAGTDSDARVAADGITCDPPHVFETVESELGNPRDPILAASGDHAAVIWGESGGSPGYEGVALSYYDFATDTWSESVDIFSEATAGFSSNDSLTVDADGDITATYRVVADRVVTHFAVSYEATSATWSDATTIPILQAPAVRSEYDRATGDVLVVALAPSNGRASVWFTRRTGTAWSAPVLLEENDDDDVATLDLDMNDVGQGVVTWSLIGHGPGSAPTAFVLPYAAGDFRREGTELAPHRLPMNRFAPQFPLTDLNDDGVGVVLLDDGMSSLSTMSAVTFDISADTVTAPASFYSDFTALIRADVAIGDDGTIAAVWNQRDSLTGPFQVWAATFVEGAWSVAEARSPSSSDLRDPAVAIDGAGTITIGWSAGTDGVEATRNTGVAGAFLEEQSLTGPTPMASAAQVVAHDSGDFLAVWQQGSEIRAMRCR